ncbi:MAG: hypothetical protein IIA65_05310, partial [Planctomycetes bacterium]|nr:hypothetical protein [Planctomycetota bacterium]
MKTIWAHSVSMSAFVWVILALLLPTGVIGQQESNKPNVLFIAVQDLNDRVEFLDAHASIETPNLERLARRGMLFPRAYYADGTEEIYDRRHDPYQWHNVAGDPQHARVITRLKGWLPAGEALQAADLTQKKTTSAEPLKQEVDVFVSGTGAYHTYRIPSVIV